ncbi:MAG: transcriptional repressor NrdR [Candidatus Riflebacteria bacterium]|nr:transcriptional repressor NrdR [Candidatus Riflebacteria bacterium]
MRCQICSHAETTVIDSRPSGDLSKVRRRRQCVSCRGRFTTYETAELTPIVVIKKDGRRQEFSREKLLAGLRKAVEKRPISVSVLEQLVDAIQGELASTMVREVPVSIIGEMVLERLVTLDKMACIRYMSVYKDFEDPREFLAEIDHLFDQHRPTSSRDRGPGGGES